MSRDLNSITNGWAYDGSRVVARIIDGDDGRPKVQLRLDLGVMQMELDGRPDGRRPHGYASLLEYYRSLDETGGAPAGRELPQAACVELQQEAVQYYYRYLALSALQHLDGVIRDTQHNLELLELVRCHVADEQLAWQLLQFFPYVRMMNAQATAQKHVAEGRYDEAMRATEQALQEIRAFGEEHGLGDVSSKMQEIQTLSELLLNIRSRRHVSPAEKLRTELQRAIEAEDYERAASLRDELKRLG